MSDALAWECRRSVDADVPLAFAWQYMTTVSNWSDPPAEFSLDGPFASGSRGTTRMPGQPPRHWVLRNVESENGYTVEGILREGALLRFHWRFEALSDRRTRLVQRIELLGDKANDYVTEVKAGFEPNLEPGMRRIAELMERAAVDGLRGS